MEPEEARHVEGFIDAFLAGSWKERWRSLLRLPPQRWVGIPLAAIGSPGRTRAGAITKWTGELGELRASPDFAKRLAKPVYVIRMGHDPSPGIVSARLEEVLDGELPILEGIVSIVPGELALVLDHEGEIYVGRTRSP